MSERARITAQKTEAKKENSISRIKKAGFSQSTSSPIDQILSLQRTIGNQAVQRLFKSGMIQAKLRIGQPNDIYEQEADRVAEQVMRMPEPRLQRQVEPEEEEEETLQPKPLANQITPLVQVQRQEEPEEEEETLQAKPLTEQITPLVQRQEEPPEEDEEAGPEREEELGEEESEPVQAKHIADSLTPLVQREVEPEEEEELERIQTKPLVNKPAPVTTGLQSQIQSLKGGGQPLPGSERAFFEPRFGADFSNVRIHNNSRAAKVAQSINARAFTLGRDVVFGSAQYAPGTSEGQRLMAHELTHVVQQNGRQLQRVQPLETSEALQVASSLGSDAKMTGGAETQGKGRSAFGANADRLARRGLGQGEVISQRPDDLRISRIARLNSLSTESWRAPISCAPAGLVQRKLTDEQLARARKPGTLACITLCYLGIPSSIWRKIVLKVLKVTSKSFERAYGQAKGRQAYRRWVRGFKAYSVLEIVKTTLEIAVLGKIAYGTVPVPSRLRMAVLKLLVRFGARAATLTSALQIVRKIAIYIELAWIVGCTGSCMLQKYMREMLKGIQLAAGAHDADAGTLHNAGGLAGVET